MGMYMYVSEEDRIRLRSVSDFDVNEAFQEALKHDPSLMIEEYPHLKKVNRFFGSKYVRDDRYNILHETPAIDVTAYQARYQLSACGKKSIVIAYLHGIINSALHKTLK